MGKSRTSSPTLGKSRYSFFGHRLSDGQLLPINRRQEVSSNGTLVIRKVDSLSDGGTYMCLARNKQGHHDSKTVQIEVKGNLLYISFFCTNTLLYGYTT